MMKATFKKFGNVGPDVSDVLGALALSIVGPDATSFSLQDIDAHNVIEHDGSLRYCRYTECWVSSMNR
jgi:hypothetical protein